MQDNNLGYVGAIPTNISVVNNINQALEYQATHSPLETIKWFKDMVRNNGDWDYKQQSSDYENFG
ncbi:hypothetical protein, partial [Sulfuricurvum sp.]|uniref:hypothetical protein n=1 Tax=Sulfuricurvum sp. TaxID=2025608 RepID=UPI003BB4C8C5